MRSRRLFTGLWSTLIEFEPRMYTAQITVESRREFSLFWPALEKLDIEVSVYDKNNNYRYMYYRGDEDQSFNSRLIQQGKHMVKASRG